MSEARPEVDRHVGAVSTAWREGKPPPLDPVRCLVWGVVVLTGLVFWPAVFALVVGGV